VSDFHRVNVIYPVHSHTRAYTSIERARMITFINATRH